MRTAVFAILPLDLCRDAVGDHLKDFQQRRGVRRRDPFCGMAVVGICGKGAGCGVPRIIETEDQPTTLRIMVAILEPFQRGASVEIFAEVKRGAVEECRASVDKPAGGGYGLRRQRCGQGEKGSGEFVPAARRRIPLRAYLERIQVVKILLESVEQGEFPFQFQQGGFVLLAPRDGARAQRFRCHAEPLGQRRNAGLGCHDRVMKQTAFLLDGMPDERQRFLRTGGLDPDFHHSPSLANREGLSRRKAVRRLGDPSGFPHAC